ncbi:hypothetical protein [Pseudorhodoferax sp. Leaf274]|uniref:hypothetical protein n=1 Tax=Pseudorhodoferax sp. Leaf274 TaxID=1736318 RepID=UPI0007026F1E|nr:hypothetical protein [Pseudorhodoferax sp. Leaf274]KQP43364.1 hypothetical protein ASF44_07335 [Pseudorhodoferax sp. Leaf274]
MRAEPTVILEVDRRLAQFIQSSRPVGPESANAQALARWRAAQEVRQILQDACPYEPGTQASHAWFVEKYGDAAGAVMDE